ncbi:hypothetical protein BGW38_000021 [Lunasporangiospora selenospora]|uniref:Uncharacterized protein n=1 Tax=Lunasporangiospora selenospora TaxID=979761 RepID=A0A9P6KJ54_9FUNG|nr:hypothetical protein BGW38_000021 [Lunasporangiospora selenospora]
MVTSYLRNDQVVRKNKCRDAFSTAIKVFTTMSQTPASASVEVSPDVVVSDDVLRSKMDNIRDQWLKNQNEEYEKRRAKRRESTDSRTRRYQVLDRTDLYHRPRYSHKERSEPFVNHDAPEIMHQYAFKAWPQVPEPPDETLAEPEIKKKATNKKPLPPDANKAKILQRMAWEHPTVNLDVGTVRANVQRTQGEGDSANIVIELIHGAV